MIDGKYRTLTGPFKIDAKKDSHEYTIEPLKVNLFKLILTRWCSRGNKLGTIQWLTSWLFNFESMKSPFWPPIGVEFKIPLGRSVKAMTHSMLNLKFLPESNEQKPTRLIRKHCSSGGYLKCNS